MTKHRIYLSFDVGEKRIGVAQADSSVRVPYPLTTIDVDGSEYDVIKQLVADTQPDVVIVGYPRNQSGETTAQTRVSEDFARKIRHFDVSVVFQDESVTSVLAQQYLQQSGRPYTKADIDAHAAAIILGDYLEAHHGH